MNAAAAFDHRGVKLREAVLGAIEASQCTVVDLGVDTDAEPVDYPDVARDLGMALRRGEAERGVLVCGSGVGASIAASKIPGIRAAVCHDTYSAHQGVEHDDMNVLCLGSEIVGAELARELVRAFLAATFDGGERSVGGWSRFESWRRWWTGRSRRRADPALEKGRDMAKSRLHELSERGVSVWMDSLSRELLETGELERLIREDAVVGVTSNPTIFQKAMSEGGWYDEQLREVLSEETRPFEVFLALAQEDIRDACDLLRPVWEQTKGVDGYVSLEVDPGLAYETEATFEQAMRFHEEVERPNLYVKIPATKPGLAAIEDSIAKGKSINVTLIFSLQRYAEVVEAYLRGLERLVAGGGDPSTVISVASFFVSRVDTEADRRLEELGRTELQGKLAVANAKLAYQHYQETFAGPRWEFLAGKGARPQRCLWASTSTKNPEYRDVLYVEELIGPSTVNTMPAETIAAFQDHGEVRGDTLTEGVEEARALLEQLAEAGVDYDDVVETLEAEGVQKFADSFDELLEGIRDKQTELVGAV